MFYWNPVQVLNMLQKALLSQSFFNFFTNKSLERYSDE